MSNKHTIESIRETLSNYKIPKDQIEKKAGFDYLKWSYALGVFLQHYPDARWEFTQWEQADGTMVDVQYYKDGSCSVECRVFVGDVSQYMWLPVTNFNNKPVGTCQDINTAKMRCLTKCISVCFGLGADIYGMDMLQETELSNKEGGVGDSSNESPIPKSTPTIKPPSSFVEDPDKSFDINSSQPVGYNKGKPYTEYNNDIQKVRKDIAYWKPKKNLNRDQQQHLDNLLALERAIISLHEEAFKS